MQTCEVCDSLCRAGGLSEQQLVEQPKNAAALNTLGRARFRTRDVVHLQTLTVVSFHAHHGVFDTLDCPKKALAQTATGRSAACTADNADTIFKLRVSV
jgi:hypothetical protein